MIEDKLQAECFQWHWNNFPDQRQMLFHVQQKAKNAIEGARFRSIGVVKGVSDLVLIADCSVHFIELKTTTSQKPEQKAFQAKVLQRGHSYWIIHTFEEFKELILRIYGQK